MKLTKVNSSDSERASILEQHPEISQRDIDSAKAALLESDNG